MNLPTDKMNLEFRSNTQGSNEQRLSRADCQLRQGHRGVVLVRLDAARSRSREGNVPLYPVEDNE